MSVILLNSLVSMFMTGIIWIIQLVHYPSFHFVSEHQWQESHSHHVSHISWIVAPMMVLELGLRGWLIYSQFNWVTVSATILLIVIWGSTFAIQVPIHNELESGKSEELIHRLVRTNWIRTVAWTLSSVLLLIGYTLNLS